MTDDIRENLPALIAVTVIGIATCAFALMQVRANAGSMDYGTFSNFIFLIPCAIMLIGSFIVVLMSQQIGRKLYLTLAGICFVLGIVVMVITSSWLSDPDIAAKLLANSEEGTIILPILNAPILIMRDIAAFIVCPTVGCIAGAWLGSRLHPVTSTNPGRKRNRKR